MADADLCHPTNSLLAVKLCLQDTTTGETLCVKDEPIILEKMDFPDPVIKVLGVIRGIYY